MELIFAAMGLLGVLQSMFHNPLHICLTTWCEKAGKCGQNEHGKKSWVEDLFSFLTNYENLYSLYLCEP